MIPFKEEYQKKQPFMKKLISIVVLAIVSFNLYSQEMQPLENKPVKTDYLAKSKKQRTVGLILITTGLAVSFIGFGITMDHYLEGPETHPDAEAVLYWSGLAMITTGVTFLAIAKKNKRKALSMSFINQSSQQLRYNTVMNTSVPSVRLRLQF